MPSLLKFLLIAAFLNALSWIVLIPIWQYPDEQAHFSQVQNFAEFGSDPEGKNTSYEIAFSEKILGTERDQNGNNSYTYHPEFNINYSDTTEGFYEQGLINLPKEARFEMIKTEATGNPPIYYFLGSIVYKIFYSNSLFTRVIAVRIFSAIIFLGTILIAYKTGQLIFRKEKLLPLVLPALLAFKPMLVFSSTGVLPDVLVNLLFAGVLYFSVKILCEGLKSKSLLAFFVILTVGVLTRQQFLIVIPIIALPVAHHFFKTKKLKLMIIPSLFLFIFLYFSNTYGTALPLFENFRIPDSSIFFSNKPSLETFLAFLKWTIRHTIAEVLPWYWGVFRWLSFTLPNIYYQIINRLILVSLLGLLIRLISIFKSRKFNRDDLILSFLILAPVIYFLFFLIWDYFFYLKNGFSFGIQGRYFFPMIVPHFTILVLGFWKVSQLVFGKFDKYLLIFIVFLMMIFNNISLGSVSASYYQTTSISTFVEQVSQYKPILFKGNIILLIIFMALITQVLFLLNLIRYMNKAKNYE